MERKWTRNAAAAEQSSPKSVIGTPSNTAKQGSMKTEARNTQTKKGGRKGLKERHRKKDRKKGKQEVRNRKRERNS